MRELAALAREVITANVYLALGTADASADAIYNGRLPPAKQG